MAGVLVAVEGLDGSGKSTASLGLQEALSALGHRCILIRPKRPEPRDPFIAAHLARLSRVLWESGGVEPRNLLGQAHWTYLSAAWFHAVDEHVVRPALLEHEVVVTDSWYPKLLARFVLKGPALFEEARRCYQTLAPPDLVAVLDVDPVIAADRKTAFGYSECGNFDGLAGTSRENFVTYQRRVREALRQVSREDTWRWIRADHLDREGVQRALVRLVQELLQARGRAARTA